MNPVVIPFKALVELSVDIMDECIVHDYPSDEVFCALYMEDGQIRCTTIILHD